MTAFVSMQKQLAVLYGIFTPVSLESCVAAIDTHHTMGQGSPHTVRSLVVAIVYDFSFDFVNAEGKCFH